MSGADSFKNLYKKMDATSKTRFHASRRLRLHAKLSTYTVVILSLVLILVSLIQAYDLGANIKRKEVVLLQVFASIAVLVYSLLIEKNDFSNRSEKMYSCASKLGELKQEAHPHKTAGYPMDGWQKFTMSAKVWGSYVLNFATYPMVAAVLVLALYWVWVGFGPATGESVATLQSPQKQSMSSAK